MPIIRGEIYRFADLWNTQTIRYQRGRPNLHTGKPIILYHHPDPPAQSYAIHPCPNTLKLLQQDVFTSAKTDPASDPSALRPDASDASPASHASCAS